MTDQTTPPDRTDGPVTVAITRRVRPEDERLMQAWVDAGTGMAARFPGFLGAGWVRPSTGSREWHMLYRFDSRHSLLLWEESRERTQWLRIAADLVQHTRVEHRTGIEGWFDEPQTRSVEEAAPAAPPRWKQAVTIWAAFFPMNVLFTALLAPLVGHWPMPLRVLPHHGAADAGDGLPRAAPRDAVAPALVEPPPSRLTAGGHREVVRSYWRIDSGMNTARIATIQISVSSSGFCSGKTSGGGSTLIAVVLPTPVRAEEPHDRALLDLQGPPSRRQAVAQATSAAASSRASAGSVGAPPGASR